MVLVPPMRSVAPLDTVRTSPAPLFVPVTVTPSRSSVPVVTVSWPLLVEPALFTVIGLDTCTVLPVPFTIRRRNTKFDVVAEPLIVCVPVPLNVTVEVPVGLVVPLFVQLPPTVMLPPVGLYVLAF